MANTIPLLECPPPDYVVCGEKILMFLCHFVSGTKKLCLLELRFDRLVLATSPLKFHTQISVAIYSMCQTHDSDGWFRQLSAIDTGCSYHNLRWVSHQRVLWITIYCTNTNSYSGCIRNNTLKRSRWIVPLCGVFIVTLFHVWASAVDASWLTARNHLFVWWRPVIGRPCRCFR